MISRDLLGLLGRQISEGKGILFAGAGLSNFAGMPTWGQMVRDMADWWRSSSSYSQATDKTIREAIESLDLGWATETIVRSTGLEQVAAYFKKALDWEVK